MPAVRVRWVGFVALLVVLLVVGAFIGSLLDPDGSTWGFAVVFAGTYLLLVLVHEVGHVLPGWFFGMRCTNLTFQFGASVRSEHRDGRDRTPSEQLWISLAGPGLHIAAASLGLTVFDRNGLSFAARVGCLFALFDGVANLLPSGRRSDGWKAVAALADIARRTVRT